MTRPPGQPDGEGADLRDDVPVVVTAPDQEGLPEQRETVDQATAEDSTPEGSTPESELERLRAQVDELQAQLAETRPIPGLGQDVAEPRGPRTGRWRPWVAGVLITLGALLAPLSILAMWAHDEVADTDRYVASVTPLGTDPAVQNAIIDRITTEIFARLDVKAVTQEAVDALAEQGLPPRAAESLKALSTPLANGVRSFVTERVTRIIKSPEFADAWIAANREAHSQLVAVLTGEGTDTIDVSGNTVSVNLAAVIETVKVQLTDAGFALADRIPEVNAQFTIMESADLAKAQGFFGLLKSLARALPVIALLLLAAAVYVARSRRRALMAAALAVAASMFLLGGALNAFRPVYLDAIPADQLPRDAAASIYDTLVYFIRLNLRAVLVVALAVAAGAWLSGPTAGALAVRRGLARVMAGIRGGGERVGVSTGPVGVFAYTYRTALRAGVIGIALVVYVQAAHPTGGWTLKVLGITVAALLLLELVARPPKEVEERVDAMAPPPAAAGTA
jgi:hypothetical protein